MFGEGAKLADVTVYGPGGKDDIKNYKGSTMTSDFGTFSAIADGEYTVNYRTLGKSGNLKSNWAINNTNQVDCLDGTNPSPTHLVLHKRMVYIFTLQIEVVMPEVFMM